MRFLAAAVLALLLAPAFAAPAGYAQRKEVRHFVDEMAKKHKFSRKELGRIFAQAEFQPAIVKAMNQPAEAPPNSWQAYRAIFLSPKRAEYFREELENYLVFTRDAHLNPLTLKGSYAGAIGIPQFMPGTYRRYAVDYDGDGRANLAASAADAIGSIGNYLRAHGWAEGEPAAVAADVTGDLWHKLAESGVAPVHRADELPAFGVKPAVPLAENTPCALVELATPGRPSEFRVTFVNFFVLTRYNRAVFYVGAVLDLADALVKAKGG